jgi:DNA-binding MarR family transcriptional regulator
MVCYFIEVTTGKIYIREVYEEDMAEQTQARKTQARMPQEKDIQASIFLNFYARVKKPIALKNTTTENEKIWLLYLGAREFDEGDWNTKSVEGATQKELCKLYGFSPSTVCESASSLAEKGLIQMLGEQEDRRERRFVLTELGRKNYEALTKHLSHLYQHRPVDKPRAPDALFNFLIPL